MRIDCIRIKNIHSFKGNHSISFDKPPLSNAGLFAITGPTGSGKSTILDVITLALFNKIPRFDAKITAFEIEKKGSVITRGTEDAYAEVDYTVHNKSYRSTWQIKQKKSKAEFHEYEMRLIQLPDTHLDVKKGAVPAMNEAIIGLNYDQFLKSILLSQGEFSKFLKSSEEERSQLLEHITGTKLYRQIGIMVYEKQKVVTAELQALKEQKKRIPILSEEQVKDITLQLKAMEEQAPILRDAHTALLSKIKGIQQWNALQKDLDQIQQNQSLLLEKQKSAEPIRIALDKHKRLDRFRENLNLWSNEKKQLATKAAEIQRLNTNLANISLELDHAMTQMKNLTKKDITRENFMDVMKIFEKKMQALEHTRKTLKSEGEAIRQLIDTVLRRGDHSILSTLRDIKQPLKLLEAIDMSINELTQNLKENDSQSTMEQNLAQARVELDHLGVLKITIGNVEKNQEALVTINQMLVQTKSDLTKLLNDVPEIEKLILKVESDIETITNQKNTQLKIIDLDSERKKLKEGEPCPLCGSEDHPYADHIFEIGHLEVELQRYFKTRDDLRKRLLDHKEESARKQTQMQMGEERLQNLTIENESLLSPLNAADRSKSSMMIESAIMEAKKHLVVLESKLSQHKVKEIIIDAKPKVQMLITKLNAYTDVDNEIKTLYSGADLHSDINQIQTDFTTALTILNTHTGSLSLLTEQNTSLTHEHNERTGQLLPQLEMLGYHGIEDALLDVLEDDKFQSFAKQMEDLAQQETMLKTNESTITKQIAELEIPPSEAQQLDALMLEVRDQNARLETMNQEIGGFKTELKQYNTTKSTIHALDKDIAAKESAAKKWVVLNELIGDAKGKHYATFAQNLSFTHLINLANKRLVQLSDRYTFEQTNIESDLEVIDHWQASVKRSVKTLSGGESFILSLALALGLSDLASHNTPIETLIIDEGFSTLDVESLDYALSTIEKLQSESNKSIGIISHVDSLKERISTQIKVNKQSSGFSTIEIVG